MYLGEVAQRTIALSDGLAVRMLELNPRPADAQGLPSGGASDCQMVSLSIDPHDVVILDD
jgi:hypothetical protein